MKTPHTWSYRLIAILASPRFFWAVVILLIVQATWIAVSGLYPMAFDEEFHLGLIKLYANHPSPFWEAHPAAGDAFGSLTRDPSYLYHYLMSFPYRLLELVTTNQMAQVLVLRASSIGLFAAGLVLYRRLLLRTKASPALVHLSLLVFVLIPVTPFLAAQINYDNLLLPLIALALLLTLKVGDSLKRRSLNVRALLQLLVVCLGASLVKYAFLPFFVAIGLYLIVRAWRTYHSWLRLGAALAAGWHNLGRWTAVGLVGTLLLLGGLAAERYGVNLLRYHTPVADCGQVLSYDHCKHYGVWIRDHNLHANKPADANQSPLYFTWQWLRGMWVRSFFTLAGPTVGYQTKGPLTLPGLSAIAFTVGGLLALALAARRVWRRYNSSALWLFTGVTLLYLAVLWIDVFKLFLYDGKPVAINGRYLWPILPWLILMVGLAATVLLGRRQQLKAALAGLVVLCFLWGGGALTYILRSNDSWRWPNQAINSANQAVQNTLGPLTPGYNNPGQYLH